MKRATLDTIRSVCVCVQNWVRGESLIGLAVVMLGVAAPVWDCHSEDLPIDVPAAITQCVPDAAPVGYGTLHYLVWDIYDAVLLAPHGVFDPNKPFALTLAYKRSMNGQDIANVSADEIERQGFHDQKHLAQWREQMTALFPDVDDHTELSGVYYPHDKTCFYKYQSQIGCIDDPEFGERFFNIWLGDDVHDPDLREALLGGPPQ